MDREVRNERLKRSELFQCDCVTTCKIFSPVVHHYPDPGLCSSVFRIRIQSSHWILIRNPNPESDPGGQQWPKKIKKIFVLKCWMFSCKLQFFIIFILPVNFSSFWSSKLWIWIQTGIQPKMLDQDPKH